MHRFITVHAIYKVGDVGNCTDITLYTCVTHVFTL